MDSKMFAVILPVLIGGLVNKIIAETRFDDNEAFEKLYNSRLYEALENEETKVWTFSVPMLFDLFHAEMSTRDFKFPEY